MSCNCGGCDCARIKDQNLALLAENAELQAHIMVLVALDEKRRDADKQFDRQLIEARGKVGDRSA